MIGSVGSPSFYVIFVIFLKYAPFELEHASKP